MADLKDCKKYEECGWRKSVGYCPENCNHFKHKDEVVVVRCKNCEHFDARGDFCEFWNGVRHPEHFCGEGERKENER